jgi:hypothetical protein
MRSRVLQLLLIVLIQLVVQMAGQVHVLSHDMEDQDKPPAACELCAAYTAMDHGLAPQIVHLPEAAVQLDVYAESGPDWSATFHPLFRSRAPPVIVRVS